MNAGSTQAGPGLKSLDYSVVQQCIHCGLCLQSCPTYVETGRERNSPRGRIALMRAVADDELPITGVFKDEMDYCLGCLACVSACPAGVDYNLLFETARADVQKKVRRSMGDSVVRWLGLRLLFGYPWALKFFARVLWFYQTAGFQRMARALGLFRLMPRRLGELEPQAPRFRFRHSNLLIGPIEKARGATRYRVALLTGCIQDVAFPDVNRATADVLLENGCDVVTPRSQGCCGSLHMHNGDPEAAAMLARRLIDSIDPSSFDAIISNAAGCGSHLKHFDRVLKDDPFYRERARLWSAKMRDVSEWLVEIGFRKPAFQPEAGQKVTFQEPCHLCHGQKISSQPKEILRSIPGLVLTEHVEPTWCCGSAGIYSITQPETSRWLRDRKMGNLAASGAKIIVTANPGCQIQLGNGLREREGSGELLVHPVLLLAEAYRREGEAPAKLRVDSPL